MNDVKHALSTVRNDRPWERGHARLLLRSALGSAAAQHGDFDHLRAAAAWLAAAQDSQSEGGISGRYRLDRGWTSSYPETTGYAIPILLSLADAQYRNVPRPRSRYRRESVYRVTGTGLLRRNTHIGGRPHGQ